MSRGSFQQEYHSKIQFMCFLSKNNTNSLGPEADISRVVRESVIGEGDQTRKRIPLPHLPIPRDIEEKNMDIGGTFREEPKLNRNPKRRYITRHGWTTGVKHLKILTKSLQTPPVPAY